MHARYEVSMFYGSKVIAKVKVDNRQTDKHTNRQTNKQTDRTKTICPDHSIRGHKNNNTFDVNMLLSTGMKNEPDIVSVTSTSWLLHSSNYKDANDFCENNLTGKLRIFNTHLTNDRDTVLKLFALLRGEQKLWNGYHLTSPWLQNMGKITVKRKIYVKKFMIYMAIELFRSCKCSF